MKNFSLSLLILFLFTNCLYSQDTIMWVPGKSIANAEYSKYYEKLKELFIKHLDSPSYKRYKTLQEEFLSKVNYSGGVEDAKMLQDSNPEKDMVMEWVAANIDKTKFKNLEEAQTESKNVELAFVEVMEQNKDYFSYLEIIFLRDDGQQMLSDVFMEVTMQYPDKF